jgi:4,5-DOPA dioxygenase extradiol
MIKKMPVLFIGHGNPMNAIEDNEFSRSWMEVGNSLQHPKAIICVSAHWETNGTRVTAMEKPRMIYDFYGFPPELYKVNYPAPGSLELVARIQELIGTKEVAPDTKWGLDHGAWSVLCRLFPSADIPVVQLSLDVTKDPQSHYELGRKLQPLRDEGVLILGSGNIVHNLRMINFTDMAFDWAIKFDENVKTWILEGIHQELIEYTRHGREADLAINSAEHFKPILYVLGLTQPGEKIHFFATRIWGGSISMRSVRFG